MIVVDASALADVLLRLPSAVRAQKRILDSDEEIHAPHLIDLEMLQVFRRLAARGGTDDARAAEALADFAAIRISRHAHAPLRERIWELRENVTAYDAAYIALAELLRCPLVTRDRRLSKAPGLRADVEVL